MVDDWREALDGFLEGLDHPVWGTAHARRVAEMTGRIAEAEGVFVDPDVVHAASRLHDVGALEPYVRPDVDHADRSVSVAPVILEQVGFDPDRVLAVSEMIARHMYYAEPPAPSSPAAVFRDANTLDLMGSVGIARILAAVGTTDWAPDMSSAVDLIRRLRRTLPDTLQHESAREIARARRARMETYLEWISGETDGLRLL